MSYLLFIRAVTPLHVGIGRTFGAHVDLPIQRDEFSFPCIWASSLKGALRSHVYRRVRDNSVEYDKLKKIFGPEPGTSEVSEYSSLISFLDARLLLIPARCLKGIWTYVTFPHAIRMLNTYASIAKQSTIQCPEPRAVSKGDKLINNKLMINEIELNSVKVEPTAFADLLKALPEEIRSIAQTYGIAIVTDDDARTIVNRSILVQYRVRLNYETKTVEEGALWSEEYVPQETVFVSALICRGRGDLTAEQVCRWVKEKIGDAVWIGGKETIGKGLVKIYFVGGTR